MKSYLMHYKGALKPFYCTNVTKRIIYTPYNYIYALINICNHSWFITILNYLLKKKKNNQHIDILFPSIL